MLSVEEALDKILARFTVLSSENVSILNSLGQVLSKDVFSSIDVPPADNSAMDGYAVNIKNSDIANYLKLPPVKLHCSMLAEDSVKLAIKNYNEK